MPSNATPSSGVYPIRLQQSETYFCNEGDERFIVCTNLLKDSEIGDEDGFERLCMNSLSQLFVLHRLSFL